MKVIGTISKQKDQHIEFTRIKNKKLDAKIAQLYAKKAEFNKWAEEKLSTLKD